MGRNKPSKAPAEVILHRDLSTNQQIGMLLGVCANMSTVLLNPERAHENIPGAQSMDGEAHQAAAVTFMKACDRLDKILDDPARWGIDYQHRLEQQYEERHEAQLKMMAAQQSESLSRKLSADHIRAPSFRYRPMLINEDGTWVAFLGNPEDIENGISGVGPNPEAALRSFDASFDGKISPAVALWLKQHEENIDQGVETTTPFPKNEDPMDPDRSSNIKNPPGGGDVSPANS